MRVWHVDTRLSACVFPRYVRVCIRCVARRLLATTEKWEIFTVAVVVAMVVVDTCHQAASLDYVLLQVAFFCLSFCLPLRRLPATFATTPLAGQ